MSLFGKDLDIRKDTNIDERINDFGINVKDFGAKGDGIHDDSKAVQAAFDHVRSGGTVYFPPNGTYKANSSTLLINKNLKLLGSNNTQLIIKGITQFDTTVTNIEFESMVFNNTEVSSGDPTVPDGVKVFKSIIYIINPNLNLSIRNCTFMWQTELQTNCLGVSADSLNTLKIKDSIFLTGGIQLLDANYFDISDNHFNGKDVNLNELIHAQHNIKGVIRNNRMINSAMDFIDLYAHGHETIVEGNHLDGGSNLYMEIKSIFRDSGVWGGSSTDLGNIKNVVIRNNFFVNNKKLGTGLHYFINGYCMDLRTTPVANDYQYYNNNLIFEGNTFEDMFVDPTITSGTFRDGLCLSGWDNVKIVNNTFKSITGHSRPLVIGQLYGSPGPTLSSQRARNILIHGNTFHSTFTAITISEADNILVDSNMIYQSADQTIPIVNGISVDQATSIRIANTTIKDDQFSIIATSIVGDITVVNCALGKLRFGNSTYVKCIANDIKGDVVFSDTINFVDFINNSHDSGSISANITISGTVNKFKLIGNTLISPRWNVYIAGSYTKFISSNNFLNYGDPHPLFQSTTVDSSKFSNGDNLLA
jgi:hypothetical protein